MDNKKGKKELVPEELSFDKTTKEYGTEETKEKLAAARRDQEFAIEVVRVQRARYKFELDWDDIPVKYPLGLEEISTIITERYLEDKSSSQIPKWQKLVSIVSKALREESLSPHLSDVDSWSKKWGWTLDLPLTKIPPFKKMEFRNRQLQEELDALAREEYANSGTWISKEDCAHLLAGKEKWMEEKVSYDVIRKETKKTW